jgi:hypothetical protein
MGINTPVLTSSSWMNTRIRLPREPRNFKLNRRLINEINASRKAGGAVPGSATFSRIDQEGSHV